LSINTHTFRGCYLLRKTGNDVNTEPQILYLIQLCRLIEENTSAEADDLYGPKCPHPLPRPQLWEELESIWGGWYFDLAFFFAVSTWIRGRHRALGANVGGLYLFAMIKSGNFDIHLDAGLIGALSGNDESSWTLCLYELSRIDCIPYC